MPEELLFIFFIVFAIFNLTNDVDWKGGARLVVGQFAQDYFDPSMRSMLTSLKTEIS